LGVELPFPKFDGQVRRFSNPSNFKHFWASNLGVELPVYRGGRSSRVLAFLFIFGFRAGQPKVAHLVDFSRSDQLVLLSPIQSR